MINLEQSTNSFYTPTISWVIYLCDDNEEFDLDDLALSTAIELPQKTTTTQLKLNINKGNNISDQSNERFYFRQKQAE